MNEATLLKPGKYGYYVTGVIYRNKEGELLKTKDGKPYQKLKLIIINGEGAGHSIYDLFFSDNTDKTYQILKSVGNEALIEKYEAEYFNLKDLIGMGGYCVVGIQKNQKGYQPENTVECYIHHNYGWLAQDFNAKSDNHDSFKIEEMKSDEGTHVFEDL